MSIFDIVREHKFKLVVVQPHFMVNFGTLGEIRHLNHLFGRFVSIDIVTSILVTNVVVFTNIIVTIYDP